jgi:predicted nucleotidyltransferase
MSVNANDPNVVLLELVAHHLGDALHEQMVFVGGAVAGLLITDPAMPAIRPTEDVDLVVQATVLREYHAVEAALIARGFVHDMSVDAPICRWRIGAVAVDVMPMEKAVLGFANRWYPLAMDTASAFTLPSQKRIKLITAPVFIATKLEAFADRGKGDFLMSHDLGDIIAVVDGRESLLDECRVQAPELLEYLQAQFATLLANRAFMQALSGHLSPDSASQDRLPLLERKLRELVSFA